MEALIPITMFLCIAAIAILRPLTRRLGGLLEALTRERTQPPLTDSTHARMMLVLEQMSRRLDLIEERLDFTERLIESDKGDTRRRLRAEPEYFAGRS